MHEPKTIDSRRYTPGKGGGAAAQQMPIRANVETIVLPPSRVPKYFAADDFAAGFTETGLAIPENHALWVVTDTPLILSLRNEGDESILLPLPEGVRRVIPIRVIGHVFVSANQDVGTSFSLWIEDLRAMEPWICAGEYRP